MRVETADQNDIYTCLMVLGIVGLTESFFGLVCLCVEIAGKSVKVPWRSRKAPKGFAQMPALHANQMVAENYVVEIFLSCNLLLYEKPG